MKDKTMKTESLSASRLPRTFTEWKAYSQAIRLRSQRLQASLHERGWALAASVGIHRCGCSLHNASIDDNMTGWCFQNPRRLKVAKQANHILNDWTVSDLAGRLIERAWRHHIANS